MVKSSEVTPKVPPNKADDSSKQVEDEVQPPTPAPLDPKEIARQRSKADLERKRRGGKNSFGKL